jgi:hypothetical protein
MKTKHLYKSKIVEHGAHGLGLGTRSEVEGWVDEFVEFWNEHGGEK